MSALKEPDLLFSTPKEECVAPGESLGVKARLANLKESQRGRQRVLQAVQPYQGQLYVDNFVLFEA
jgi:hypothetical protein